MNLARDGQGPSTPSSSRGPRRLSVTPRARPTRAEFSVMALGDTEPPVAPPPPAANSGQAQPVWGRQDNLPRFLTGRPEDPRRPRIYFLCWTPGHMSYTCPILTDQQKALVNKARESFPQATRSRGAGQDEKGRVTRTYNRQIRIAMVQDLCDEVGRRGHARVGPWEPVGERAGQARLGERLVGGGHLSDPPLWASPCAGPASKCVPKLIKIPA